MMQTIVTAFVSAVIGSLFSAAAALVTAGKRMARRQKATEDGLQCLLRAEIIRTYEKSRERGYSPLYAKESVRRAYASYHGLGGNDVATELYHQILEMDGMPHEEKEE